jgi:hypothetical protein
MQMLQPSSLNDGASACSSLERQLSDLDKLTTSQLRTLWQKQYQVQVPMSLSRDLLIRFIAHRLQEEELGGLGKAMLRRLETIASRLRDPDPTSQQGAASLKPGTTLIREWNGTTYTVLVLEDGFELEGVRYPSLTKVAAAISGIHRSGRAFFGLKSRLTRFEEQGRGLVAREVERE